ncbi:hypothetical protein G6L94_11640 [Agrobacterium rhizogenes]|nr:hypothetical protein [Rhizobium rhizogenes]NTI94343.1 hypothetical protein [Rhizobium rhizogenes]NTJ56810.1 hypothetical protein [Rhizobium rhizogenes]OCJ30837.1 hypothetical protein A6U89_00035 [Agrobacterium sp. B133/95]
MRDLIGAHVALLGYTVATKHAHDVRRYYEKEGLEFLKADDFAGPGVRWKTRGKEDTFYRRQIHAGRVLVDLLQADFAEKLGVTRTAVTKFETDLSTKRPVEYFELAMKVLEEAGVIFLPDSDDGGFGVRFAVADGSD